MEQQLVDGADNQRDSDRTAMFVAATLCDEHTHHATRIRNMSPHGALIEGATLPPPGAAVALVRGELTVTGHVAWVHNGRAGVALDHDVDVAAWMTVKGNNRQQEIDRMMSELRDQLRHVAPAGSVPMAPADPQPTFQQGPAEPVPGAAEELTLVGALLARLEEELTDDPHVIARHMTALQAIDEAQQRLAALANRMKV